MIQAVANGHEKLEVARELLATLSTATIPGQHYLMEKVIDLLGRETSRPDRRLTDGYRQTIARSMNELQREASRLVPDDTAFVQRAESVLDVLAQV